MDGPDQNDSKMESNYTPNLCRAVSHPHHMHTQWNQGTHFDLLDSYTTYDIETAGTTWWVPRNSSRQHAFLIHTTTTTAHLR